MKSTKIVCTIGLKTEKEEYMSALIDAGMNVMRLNFSHGDYEEHGGRITTLRKLMKEKNQHVAILLDTKGPEIRTGKVEGDDLVITAGQEVVLTTEKVPCEGNRISVSYDKISEDVEVGGTVLLDDGLIVLTVVSKTATEVVCKAKNNGTIGSTRGVNLPGAKLQLPALADKDKEDLIWGCQQGIDYVAASFIRKASDVQYIKELLRANGGEHIKVISKIENQEGLDNFEEILEESHGIMVARGDLGVEIPLEEVPIAQKMMVQRCVQESKIAITATQMLDSMMKNPRPTRAEAADVANAVFDGTDAVMLSGETAKHNCAYPVEAVETMASICKRVEREMEGPDFDLTSQNDQGNMPMVEAFAKAAVDLAKTVDAKLIVAVSVGGRTARKLRKYFPKQRILVITSEEITARQVALLRGVQGEVVQNIESFDNLYEEILKLAKEKNLVAAGDKLVVTCSSSTQGKGKTDMIKLLTA